MKKILVIEDDARTRNLFLDCLDAEGFYSIGAENGIIGVQQAQEQLPDVVVCDIAMPELDGYEVFNTLRHNPVTATIPFIFLTATTPNRELPECTELKVDNYLTKPSTAEEFLRAIAVQLEKRSCLNSDGGDASTFESIFPSSSQLRQVFEFIEANYHRQITLGDVAQAVGYSPAYLTNRVGSQTGRTVSRWIVERRMAEARSLLQHSDWSVDRIAHSVGYENACHFFRQFRQYHNTTPKAWRKLKQKA